MMKQRLRVGLIGMGGVGLLHLKAYKAARHVEVVAVADSSQDRLAHVEDAGIARYTDARTMLARESLDIACVLTPASSHEALVGLCVEHGIDVLCEKPLAPTVAAAERMIANAAANGVRLCYGSSYRFLPAVRAAKEQIAAGCIGEVRVMREQAVGGRGAAGLQLMPQSHYPEGGPGGFAMGLIDHGIHLIDVFGWFADSPVRRAVGRGNISGGPVLSEHLSLEYESGAVGQLIYDEATYPTEMPGEGVFSLGDGWDVDGFVSAGKWTRYPGCIHVFGTKGALRIFHYANYLYHFDEAGARQIPLEGLASPCHFAAQIDCLAEDIASGRPTSMPGELGSTALGILMSIY